MARGYGRIRTRRRKSRPGKNREARGRERTNEDGGEERSRWLNREEIECSSNIEEDSGFARIVSVRPLLDSSDVHRLPRSVPRRGSLLAANAFRAVTHAESAASTDTGMSRE